jgi:hypothetical protein
MGMIQNPANLKEMCEKFGIKNYVETGVGTGRGMKHVLEHAAIDKAYGIELDERLFDTYNEVFQEYSVEFFKGYSHEEMSNVLTKLDNNPTLFWLDAHFPGGDYFDEGYGKEKDFVKRLPMEEELRIISQNRDISSDIIFMDDLRIYVDRDFGQGNWDDRKTLGGDGYQFVEDLIGETHTINEHLGDEGYLLAFPIKYSEEEILSILN